MCFLPPLHSALGEGTEVAGDEPLGIHARVASEEFLKPLHILAAHAERERSRERRRGGGACRREGGGAGGSEFRAELGHLGLERLDLEEERLDLPLERFDAWGLCVCKRESACGYKRHEYADDEVFPGHFQQSCYVRPIAARCVARLLRHKPLCVGYKCEWPLFGDVPHKSNYIISPLRAAAPVIIRFQSSCILIA